MFNEVSSKVDFVKMEEAILRFWQEHETFRRSMELRAAAPRFVFYEGPPTANGLPGIHHVLGRVFKDTIPRYQTMKGHYALRKGGWDTHGLPVEIEVEKELGFTGLGKQAIEDYGVAEFNAKCVAVHLFEEAKPEGVVQSVRAGDDASGKFAVFVVRHGKDSLR